MKIWTACMIALLSADLIVDAIYGIGFRGSLNNFETRVVQMVNLCKAPVVAVDIPSGVEADTGKVHGTALKARLHGNLCPAQIGTDFRARPRLCG